MTRSAPLLAAMALGSFEVFEMILCSANDQSLVSEDQGRRGAILVSLGSRNLHSTHNWAFNNPAPQYKACLRSSKTYFRLSTLVCGETLLAQVIATCKEFALKRPMNNNMDINTFAPNQLCPVAIAFQGHQHQEHPRVSCPEHYVVRLALGYEASVKQPSSYAEGFPPLLKRNRSCECLPKASDT